MRLLICCFWAILRARLPFSWSWGTQDEIVHPTRYSSPPSLNSSILRSPDWELSQFLMTAWAESAQTITLLARPTPSSRAISSYRFLLHSYFLIYQVAPHIPYSPPSSLAKSTDSFSAAQRKNLHSASELAILRIYFLSKDTLISLIFQFALEFYHYQRY